MVLFPWLEISESSQIYSSAPIRFDLLLCLAGKILPTSSPGCRSGAGISPGRTAVGMQGYRVPAGHPSVPVELPASTGIAPLVSCRHCSWGSCDGWIGFAQPSGTIPAGSSSSCMSCTFTQLCAQVFFLDLLRLLCGCLPGLILVLPHRSDCVSRGPMPPSPPSCLPGMHPACGPHCRECRQGAELHRQGAWGCRCRGGRETC